MDRATRQMISKETEDIKNTMYQLDLRDIYRTLHLISAHSIQEYMGQSPR